ncbi:putative toxin-antitoxin system toxin component, PIN family [Prevotella communis]|uniref:putative toxin-antitoxin system toxin component, PIN family n=1 Tax=Prevotella communis TaxID=2913614 RepID=UPI001EDC0AC4|nr:putative toxin-antitoxin system toxin component, PIN family [Prevotella communis]UKK69134.1 putative toxin-antitoxin system toxin component, PIN family [Prevotella communis]UKK71840.1 putative toxin-antitoxin system toxin component, PIN family [Prevotella communis]
MMRIVLDTNSLIQSISSKSTYHEVWQSVLTGRNTLCISNEILEEYAEILNRLAGKKTADLVLTTIIECKNVVFLTPYYHFNLITADPDDNKFVDCAIQANARYIVTNDHHYDGLRQIEFPKVGIIKLMDFLQMIHE